MIAFLKSGLGRYLLEGLALGAVLFGAYSFGHSNGYDSGHKAGYESRNTEVSHLNDNVIALSKLIDTERKQQFEKLQDVQATAAEAAIKTETRLQTQIRARDQVIANYSKTVPTTVQQQCGLSIETVRAINQLIDKVNGEPNETPKANAADSGSKDAGDSAGALHGADADGVRSRPTTEEAVGRRNPVAEEHRGQDPGEDAGALQEVAAYGRPSALAERDIGVHEHVADASSGVP